MLFKLFYVSLGIGKVATNFLIKVLLDVRWSRVTTFEENFGDAAVFNWNEILCLIYFCFFMSAVIENALCYLKRLVWFF